MKKKSLILLLIILLNFGFGTALAKEFPDVSKTHPNFAAIDFLSEQGVLQGYDDGTFKPAQLVNRAETLKIIFAGIKADIDDKIETGNLFKDVIGEEWFAKYLAHAKLKEIVSGNPDGTYAPARTVIRAEFVKIMLNAVGFNPGQWLGQELFADVPKEAWFNPFMNYAGKAGLITKDAANKLFPQKELSRGEVAEIFYLLLVVLNGKDSQFLLNQAEAQMALIEGYIRDENIVSAKRASELSVDMTQQALKNLPEDKIVLGAAKIARAYDYLVTSFVFALQKNYVEAKKYAEMVIVKADEALSVNGELAKLAEHLKNRANEIIGQLPE